mmetsp:Transcript_4382/g.13251  ORF Transcript_4382/g.13251 Transcript_4382/m.13251 type:complete len:282 (+) Transcript_4382:758-1603(+)
MNHLERLLTASSAPRKLIVSDSLFSMDGDEAKLRELVTLKERHGALLMLDEAHATLVYGHNGGGLAEARGLADHVDIHTGNLSKAFGAHGGFVGCSARLKSLLVSRGRPGIYSTALPAPAAAAAIAALEVATPRLRATLRRNVFVFRAAIGIDHGDDTQSQRRPPHLQIKQEGWFGMKGDPMECAPVSYPNHVTKAETRPFDADTCSPIVPILVGSEHAALAASERLEHMGYLVPAIRPPTVPAGTARLRVALSAAHTVDEIEGFARALRQTGVLSPECGL